MTEKSWFYQVDGRHLGPLALNELFRLYHAGEIKDETFLWRMGQDDWRPLAQVPELFLALNPETKRDPHAPPPVANIMQSEDLAEQSRLEIARDIPPPKLEKVTQMRPFPQQPFGLEQKSAQTANEPPKLSSQFHVDEYYSSDSMMQESFALPASNMHEAIGVNEEVPNEVQAEEVSVNNPALKTEDVGPNVKNSTAISTVFVLMVTGALFVSMTAGLGIKWWSLLREDSQYSQAIFQVPEFDRTKPMSFYSIRMPDQTLHLKFSQSGASEGQLKLKSEAWDNQSLQAVALEKNITLQGPWAELKFQEGQLIPDGRYSVVLELSNQEWTARFFEKVSSFLPLPKAFQIHANWQGMMEVFIGSNEAKEQLARHQAIRKNYEEVQLAPLREAMIKVKTITELWSQVQSLYETSKSSKEFEIEYAQKMAPVFQGISQEVSDLPENHSLKTPLLALCIDFGEAVVKMSMLLATRDVVPKKGQKINLDASNAALSALQALADKIKGEVATLQRDLEERLAHFEIKN